MLIQKDFKQKSGRICLLMCLRVLLIQKDFKHTISHSITSHGLRVLLIQKDFKQKFSCPYLIKKFESLVNTEGFQTDDDEL